MGMCARCHSQDRREGRGLLMLGQGWPIHPGVVEGTVVLVSAAAFHGEVTTYGTL